MKKKFIKKLRSFKEIVNKRGFNNTSSWKVFNKHCLTWNTFSNTIIYHPIDPIIQHYELVSLVLYLRH